MAWTVKLLWRLLHSERLEETRGQSCLHTRLQRFKLVNLPSRCIVGRDAPCQVVIAVVTARVVKEVSSGGQDVVGDSSSALLTMDQTQVRKQSGRSALPVDAGYVLPVKYLLSCRNTTF